MQTLCIHLLGNWTVSVNGEGKLIRNGEVFEGEFEEGQFIGTLE